jgi:hypothetical protein
MTTSGGAGDFTMECDYCSDIFESIEYDFHVFIGEARKEGWYIRKSNGFWYHKCPDCVEKGVPWS